MGKPAHFVIVGGGTAGWIAAFIIQDEARRRGFDFRISVVESSRIPTVGVGEATTAAFRVLLKHFGIDEFEFFRKTDASFKLGIRHEDWRRRGYTYYGPIDDPHQVIKAPPGAPSDYLNVYAVAAGRAVQEMHMFQPLLEQKKGALCAEARWVADCAGAVSSCVSFRSGAGGQVFCQQIQGRREGRCLGGGRGAQWRDRGYFGAGARR
jgi:tryptophan halogenase